MLRRAFLVKEIGMLKKAKRVLKIVVDKNRFQFFGSNAQLCLACNFIKKFYSHVIYNNPLLLVIIVNLVSNMYLLSLSLGLRKIMCSY